MSEVACTHWHRLGERCECGHVTVPARFYNVTPTGELSQEKAEAAYLGFLKDNIPDLYERLNRPGPSWDPRLNNQVAEQLQGNNQVAKQYGGKRVGAGRPRN